MVNENFFAIYIDNQHEVDTEGYRTLSSVIHDIWSGNLTYYGPKPGIQNVNLELMMDQCWKCEKEMKTVTGIVFPDKQLTSWSNADWFYFKTLIPLASIKSDHAEVIKLNINRLRETDSSITPINFSYSGTVKTYYWAAHCPHCNSLRGNSYVNDIRKNFLVSIKSRLNNNLSYHSIELIVDNDLLEILGRDKELNPHSGPIGWF